MTEETGIPLEEPHSILQKEVNVDFKGLLVTLGKASINLAFLKWDSVAENGVELLESLGLGKTTGEVAGLLILRSLKSAFKELIRGSEDLFIEFPENCQDLFKQIGEALNSSDFILDNSFFDYPQQLPFFKEVQSGFEVWLMSRISNKIEAKNISNRLPDYFADALFKEWKTHPADYQILLEELDNPFLEAVEREKAWYYYRAWLQKQVQEPIFWESFSLKGIYIPLRSYYEKKADNSSDLSPISERKNELESQNNTRVVVDLAEELTAWLEASKPEDAIRLLTGSPGSGKSSFTKIFAAKQAENGRNVLFIPLHHFDLKDDLVESVGKFVELAGFLTENPLKPSNSELNLLIIFDGLDELSKQGNVAEEVARDFVNRVWDTVKRFNEFQGNPKTRLQVIISGREVVIQGNSSKFNKPEQLLYLLPYFLSENEIKKYKYLDNNKLKEDQRQLWWQKYAQIKGKDYQGLPDALNRDNLTDITAQPLLNYLIALSYERDKINFISDTNLNEIYEDLLDSVYERGYEKQGHLIIEGIEKREFITVLMEIALAVWHGNGRTTTVKEIEIHCESGGLKRLLEKFQNSFRESSQANITRLLTAFYFRESGDIRGSEKTFEFTHKSFGEYLTARRIVLGLKTIADKLKNSAENYADDYHEKDALIAWAKLCGASSMDSYIFAFVWGEMRLQEKETVQQWQQLLCRLIEYLMVRGMPMEALNLSSFKVALEQSVNGEIALLAVLNACGRVTQELSVIKWHTPEVFGEWIGRLVGQRKDWEPIFVLDCLSYLDLQECDLRLRDFYRANLKGANLGGANLGGANLLEANLLEANLEEAYLLEANLFGAILFRANLEGANLEGANLEGANLFGANLERANLEVANLKEANLEGAYLFGANLKEANLEGAYLEGANLFGAYLEKTILEGSNINEITRGN